MHQVCEASLGDGWLSGGSWGGVLFGCILGSVRGAKLGRGSLVAIKEKSMVPRPCGLAPEASALDHSAKLSCFLSLRFFCG